MVRPSGKASKNGGGSDVWSGQEKIEKGRKSKKILPKWREKKCSVRTRTRLAPDSV